MAAAFSGKTDMAVNFAILSWMSETKEGKEFAVKAGVVVGATLIVAYIAKRFGLPAKVGAIVRKIKASFLKKYAAKVTIDKRKFTQYIFKQGADHGKDAVYRGLGYSKRHSNKLYRLYKKQAQKQLASGNYKLGKLDKWGQRIDIEITLPGIGKAKGKSSSIKSGWMLLEDGSIQLNTPFSGFMR